MRHLSPSRARLPVIGGLLGLTGMIGMLGLRNRKRRPSAADLMRMSDEEFAAFVSASGIKTVTTAGLATGGIAD